MPRLRVLLAGLAIATVAAVAVSVWLKWELQGLARRDWRAEQADVSFSGGPSVFLTGRFPQLDLRVRRGMLGEVPFEEMQASFTDVDIDLPAVRHGMLRVPRIGAGQAALVLTEQNLQAYLAQARGISGARVRLADGAVTVAGTIAVLAFHMDVFMQGRLEVDDRRVSLRVDTLSISGVQVPPTLSAALAAAMNPLLTAEQLPLPLRFQRADAADGRLVIAAAPSR